MHLALTQPSLVSRLVVVDIAPTTYSWKDRLDHNTDFTDASKDSIPYIFNSLKTLQDLSAFRTRKEVDVALEKLIPVRSSTIKSDAQFYGCLNRISVCANFC